MTREERLQLMSSEARYDRKRYHIFPMCSLEGNIGARRFKYFLERKKFWKAANTANPDHWKVIWTTDNDTYCFVRSMYELG